MVEVLWERLIGSVMLYLLEMAYERRQACPSVGVKEKQWSFSEIRSNLGYGRTLIPHCPTLKVLGGAEGRGYSTQRCPPVFPPKTL